LGTYGSLGGMARESCFYPEADFWYCAIFVHAFGIFSTKTPHHQKPLNLALAFWDF